MRRCCNKEMLKRNIIFIGMIMMVIFSFTGCAASGKIEELAASEQDNVPNRTEELPVMETETKQEQGDEEENLESTE